MNKKRKATDISGTRPRKKQVIEKQIIGRGCSDNYCYNTATTVHVMEDPYYGYGHYPKLFCDTCKPASIWYDGKHKYNPEYDDYFLGYTKKEPMHWTRTNQLIDCFDCNEPIVPWTEYASLYLRICGVCKYPELTICKECFVSYGIEVKPVDIVFDKAMIDPIESKDPTIKAIESKDPVIIKTSLLLIPSDGKYDCFDCMESFDKGTMVANIELTIYNDSKKNICVCKDCFEKYKAETCKARMMFRYST